MPLQSPWSRIPLRVRWGISLLVAAVLTVLLVVFVDHNTGNGLAHVSSRGLKAETRQAEIVVSQDQAPVKVRIAAGGSPRAALVAGVRHDMNRRITNATIPGPLTRVGCSQTGRRGDRIGYHCVAIADHIGYPFDAVATPSRRSAALCKKDFPPDPAQNIPVSDRCVLSG